MPHYPCSDCCDEFEQTCSGFDITGCFPQALEDTEITITLPAYTGSSPCDDLEGTYVLVWDDFSQTFEYLASDFFGAGADLSIALGFSCVDGECYPTLYILYQGGLNYSGGVFGGIASGPMVDTTLPFELPILTMSDVGWPCSDPGGSAYITAVTGF